MKIDATHPEYDKAAPLWKKCRDCIEGEEAVKAAKSLYLPMLSGDSQRYDAYLKRALYFNATGRTAAALQGFLFRKPAQIAPETESVVGFSAQGTVSDFTRKMAIELISVGRVGVLVDAPVGGGDPVMSQYVAEDIINWRVDADGNSALVVLRECRLAPNPDDPFVVEEKTFYRVLRLEDGRYLQELYLQDDDKFILQSSIVPARNGSALGYIPFVCVNAVGGVSFNVVKPPLLDLVNVNLSHYRSSADLENGRHFVGFPTPWAAGFDLGAGESLEIGSVAWVTDNENAKAGFLEFTGQGLTALENALKEKSEMMAVLGARLLEPQKKMAEAADTHRLRNAGEQATLSEIARSGDEGATRALRICAEWRRRPDWESYGLTLNRDYAATIANPQLVTTMFGALQGGAVSFETWLGNLKAWELIPESRTLDEELALIDARRGDEFGA